MPCNRMPFMNTYIDNVTEAEALAYIREWISSRRTGMIITPNSDQIVQLESSARLREIWSSAELLLADGAPLLKIARWYKTPIREKLSGSDFVPVLMETAAQNGYSVFLLGAGPGVAAKAAEILKARYPGLRIVGVLSPSYGFETDPEEIRQINQTLRRSGADILVVGLGAPKQEIFMYENMRHYGIPVSIGSGAAIDFIAGAQKRAPKWMRRLSLEWFYRLLRQPRRMAGRVLRDFGIFRLAWRYYPRPRAQYRGKNYDRVD